MICKQVQTISINQRNAKIRVTTDNEKEKKKYQTTALKALFCPKAKKALGQSPP